jgi:transcriptional regulator with XRE-family HTH domain
MRDGVTGTTIRDRAQAIGLPLKQLAAEAGLSEHTVKNLKRELPGVTARTLKSALEVVIRHELEMRNYLLGLHGLPEAEPAKDQAA